MSSTSRLAGLCDLSPVVICPLITPLTPAQELDRAALTTQVARVAPHVDALMLLGTTGELPTLGRHVADELVRQVLAVEPSVPLVLGVGGAGLAQTLEQLGRVESGIDCVAVCAPYYYDVGDFELSRYFSTVADVSPVPVLLYNIPQHTGNPMPASVVQDLAAHDNVIGLKDSWPDRDDFARLLACADESFVVLRGTDELHAADYLEAGVAGFVAGLENLVPGLMRRLIRDWTDRRVDEVHAHYDTLRPLVAAVTRHGGARAIKHRVAHLVGSGASPALPAVPLAPGPAAEVEAAVTTALARLASTSTAG